ncbi:hypothetical protein [Microcoleus sp.]
MPTPQEINYLWNRPESLFLRMVQDVSFNLFLTEQVQFIAAARLKTLALS